MPGRQLKAEALRLSQWTGEGDCVSLAEFFSCIPCLYRVYRIKLTVKLPYQPHANSLTVMTWIYLHITKQYKSPVLIRDLFHAQAITMGCAKWGSIIICKDLGLASSVCWLVIGTRSAHCGASPIRRATAGPELKYHFSTCPRRFM